VGLVVAPHIVLRIAVLGEGRAARGDLGEVLGDDVGVAAVEQLVEVGVAVEVVEVLQEREVERLAEVGIRLVAGQPGGQVHGHLLVADRRLQRVLVAGVEAVDGPLLLGVGAAALGQGDLQLTVVRLPGELVGEEDRLDLDPVHQDHPGPGIGVDRSLVIGLDVELRPVAELLGHGDALLVQGVEGHKTLLSVAGTGWRGRQASGGPAG
jgi:hypothetical protein